MKANDVDRLGWLEPVPNRNRSSIPVPLVRFMSGNGLKRKLDASDHYLEEDGGPVSVPPASYGLQRQTVLNMSLMKLYGPRTGADLGLQRRVLINNIVRRIHEDFRREGGVGALFFSAAPPVVTSAAGCDDDAYRQPLAPPSPSFGLLSSSLSGRAALDSCLTPASLLEEDLPVFFTLPSSSSPSSPQLAARPPPPSPPAKDSFSSALEEIEELCPASSSCPPSPPPARVVFDVVMKEERRGSQEAGNRSEKPPPPLPPPSLAPSGSFLTDFTLDDVLFTDIDTSMYDLGPCPSPPGVPPSKMAAEDLVQAVSAYGPAGAGPQNQPLKMDLAELDHIMEVLVGS